MQYKQSIEFLRVDNKQVILQFEIQTISYDRFKVKFTTDKYINIPQWEQIRAKLKRAIDGILNCKDWRTRKNKFVVDGLMIEYETVDKEDGVINYEKINYELDWVLKIKISQLSTIQHSSELSSSQSCDAKDYSSNEENHKDVHHEHKKPKLDKSAHSSKSPVLAPKNAHNSKFSKEKKLYTKAQPSITGWIEVKHNKESKEESKPQRSSQRSKNGKSSTSKDSSITPLNKEQLQQMNDFVARSEQEELIKEKRKKELEGYEIWTCHNMSNEQIIETIQSLEDSINDLFQNYKLELILEGQLISALDISSSNILNSDQMMLVLKEIDKLCSVEESGTKEKILHDVACPYVIIELFQKEHSLSTKSALERIKIQDEKKTLYNMSIDE